MRLIFFNFYYQNYIETSQFNKQRFLLLFILLILKMSKEKEAIIRQYIENLRSTEQSLSSHGSGRYSKVKNTMNPNLIKRKFRWDEDSISSCMSIQRSRIIADYFYKHPQCLQYSGRMIMIKIKEEQVVYYIQKYDKNIYELYTEGLKVETLRDSLDSDQGYLPPPIELTISIVLQLIIGVSILHKHNIIHNDLSPRNIMVSDTFALKLIDFDNVIFLKEDYKHLCGTPWYKAKSYYKKLNDFFMDLFKQEINSIHIIAQQIFYMEDPHYLDDPNQDVKSYGETDQIYEKVKKRKLKPNLQVQCSNIRIIKLIEELLKALQTEDSLEQIMKSSSFQALKIFIQDSQYKIIESEDFKLIPESQFKRKQVDLKNSIKKYCDEVNDEANAEVIELINKMSGKIQSLAGGNNNSIITLLGSADKDKNGIIDLNQFTTFVKEILNIDIKNSLIKTVFDHLDRNHSKALDEGQIITLFSTMKPQQMEELKKKLMRKNMLNRLKKQKEDQRTSTAMNFKKK